MIALDSGALIAFLAGATGRDTDLVDRLLADHPSGDRNAPALPQVASGSQSGMRRGAGRGGATAARGG